MYPEKNLSQLPLFLPQISNDSFMYLFTYYNYRSTFSTHDLDLNKGRLFSDKSNKIFDIKLNWFNSCYRVNTFNLGYKNQSVIAM